MALFKIFKGQSEDLENVKATNGYAYFTPDDGNFYIDVDTAESAKVGATDEDGANRICITPSILDCGNAQ